MTLISDLITIKDELQIDPTDTSQDALISRLIDSATSYIEEYTGRSFSTGVGTRLFDGYDKGFLMVDDFQSLNSVELLNTDLTTWKTFNPTTELVTYPLNSVPKNKIIINNITSENPYRVIGRSPYIFPKGYGNVKVTANWGSYAVIPPALVGAGINLITAKVNKAKIRGVRSVSLGGESMSFTDTDGDVTVRETLEFYKIQFVDIW